ncbi:RUN and FYVE domain-containing protein 2 isoform X1 [Rana temporaria]|uniref:RUN and FYVE domain-containing protein 2 isoform X1 n=1 Tax=Rana temporaria TaxID=8407 RepID=UPI001AAC5371|nr:RUN and FYVE domain-containing protein 2 isoform X1 [Rana temporaria]
MAQFGAPRNPVNWVSHLTAAVVSQPAKDPAVVERANLLNMAKLSIKGLIESALSYGRTLDSDYPPLQQFFVVMEHCLKHGLKVRKSFLSFNRTIWGPLELVEKLCPEAEEIAASVRDLPGLRTPLGRARAWLRLSMMQKKLADYLRCLIMRRDLLSEFYENYAVMMEEEGTVIVGLLVGLNVIDANLCVKGEDLDSQVGVIDFSIYLKSDEDNHDREGRNVHISAILDQKNYVEELNRQLNGTVSSLHGRIDTMEKSNAKLIEELAIAKNNIIKLQEENHQLRNDNAMIFMKAHQHLEHPAFLCTALCTSYRVTSSLARCSEDNTGLAAKASIEAEQMYRQHARHGLNEIFTDICTHHEDAQLRQESDTDLEPARVQHEIELAVKLLEKDILEKQDTLIGLKEQLEEVKAINFEMYQKMQCSEEEARKRDANDGQDGKSTQMSACRKPYEESDKDVLSQSRNIEISYMKAASVESAPQYKLIKDISF